VTLPIDSIARKRAAAGGAVRGSTAFFVFGYLAVWVTFATASTTLQWTLGEAGLLSETMAFGNIVLADSVLSGGTLENAQVMAAHESPRTTKLYDRTGDEITSDQVEGITI
jgi:predicted metal-binding membrane protein